MQKNIISRIYSKSKREQRHTLPPPALSQLETPGLAATHAVLTSSRMGSSSLLARGLPAGPRLRLSAAMTDALPPSAAGTRSRKARGAGAWPAPQLCLASHSAKKSLYPLHSKIRLAPVLCLSVRQHNLPRFPMTPEVELNKIHSRRKLGPARTLSFPVHHVLASILLAIPENRHLPTRYIVNN